VDTRSGTLCRLGKDTFVSNQEGGNRKKKRNKGCHPATLSSAPREMYLTKGKGWSVGRAGERALVNSRSEELARKIQQETALGLVKTIQAPKVGGKKVKAPAMSSGV